MAVVIQNLGLRKPISLRLNSGDSLLLGPGGFSSKISETEVKDNPKIKKLLAQHYISFQPTGKKELSIARPKPKKEKPKKAASKNRKK